MVYHLYMMTKKEQLMSGSTKTKAKFTLLSSYRFQLIQNCTILHVKKIHYTGAKHVGDMGGEVYLFLFENYIKIS